MQWDRVSECGEEMIASVQLLLQATCGAYSTQSSHFYLQSPEGLEAGFKFLPLTSMWTSAAGLTDLTLNNFELIIACS